MIKEDYAMYTKHKYWIVKIHRDITGNTLFMTPLMKIKYAYYSTHETVCRSLNCKECKENGMLLDLNLSDCEEYDKLIIRDAGWVIVRGPEQCELDTLNEEYIKWLKGENKKEEENTMDDKKKALVKFDQTTFIPGSCYELTNMRNNFRYVMLLKSYAEDELVFTRVDGTEYKYRLGDPAIVINPTKKLSDGPSIRKSEYVVYKKDYSKVFDTKKLYQLHNKVSNRLYAAFKFEHYSEKEHCFVFVRINPDSTDSVNCVSVFVNDILIRDIWEIKETGEDICATMRAEE